MTKYCPICKHNKLKISKRKISKGFKPYKKPIHTATGIKFEKAQRKYYSGVVRWVLKCPKCGWRQR